MATNTTAGVADGVLVDGPAEHGVVEQPLPAGHLGVRRVDGDVERHDPGAGGEVGDRLDVGLPLGHVRVAELGHLQPAERVRRVGPDDQLVGLQVALVGVGHVGGGDDDDRDRDAEGEGDRAEGRRRA